MLDSKASNRRSAKNEAAIAEQFKKLRYSVEKLDRKATKGRRPDFLISTSTGNPLLLCEVKTVDSAFYPRDKLKYGVEHVHISTLDDRFRGNFRNIPIDLTKIDNALAEAIKQRDEFIGHKPHLATVPLLVAIFLDEFAREYLFAYPRSFDKRSHGFQEISGILTIANDVERNKAFKKLSDEEQEQHIKAELETGRSPILLPPHSTDFALVPNQAAIRPVPTEFARLCLPDDYYR